jgi:hypothetical protein
MHFFSVVNDCPSKLPSDAQGIVLCQADRHIWACQAAAIAPSFELNKEGMCSTKRRSAWRMQQVLEYPSRTLPSQLLMTADLPQRDVCFIV